MLDAVDADLAAARLDGEAAAAFDGDEVGEVGARHRQVVGEDDADARLRRVGVDLVGEDAEAVLGDAPCRRWRGRRRLRLIARLAR